MLFRLRKDSAISPSLISCVFPNNFLQCLVLRFFSEDVPSVSQPRLKERGASWAYDHPREAYSEVGEPRSVVIYSVSPHTSGFFCFNHK